MTDEADRYQEAGLETVKLRLVSENESVVRQAMQEHEGLVESWVQDWRLSLFPCGAGESETKLPSRKRESKNRVADKV